MVNLPQTMNPHVARATDNTTTAIIIVRASARLIWPLSWGRVFRSSRISRKSMRAFKERRKGRFNEKAPLKVSHPAAEYESANEYSDAENKRRVSDETHFQVHLLAPHCLLWVNLLLSFNGILN